MTDRLINIPPTDEITDTKSGNIEEKLLENEQINNLINNIIPKIKGHDLLGHVLFICPDKRISDCFCNMLSKMWGRYYRTCSLNIKASDYAAILTNLEDGDILCTRNEQLDLSLEQIDVLKTSMSVFAIDIIIGKGPSAQSVRINLPGFTLVTCVEKESDSLLQLYPYFEHVIEINDHELIKLSAAIQSMDKNISIADEAVDYIINFSESNSLQILKNLKKVLVKHNSTGRTDFITLEFVKKILNPSGKKGSTNPNIGRIDTRLMTDIKNSLDFLKKEVKLLRKDIEELKEDSSKLDNILLYVEELSRFN